MTDNKIDEPNKQELKAQDQIIPHRPVSTQ